MKTTIKNIFIAFFVLLLFVFILSKVFGLRIIASKVYFGSQPSYMGAHVAVDATAAFQNSGIYVNKGDKLFIKPYGRIHIAMDHTNNLIRSVKGILVRNTNGKEFNEEQKRRFPAQELAPDLFFYRDWCGPEGEKTYSDLLEDCKLRKEVGWGALLLTIFPEDVSSSKDPFEVLKDYKMKISDLIEIPSEMTYECKKDGYLTFIINEAVISSFSNSKESKLYYETLKQSSEDMKNHPNHKIPLESIPLLWFADNNGTFRLTITEK